VPITVTDDRGRFVSNLEAKDFPHLDDGPAAADPILQSRPETAHRGGVPHRHEQQHAGALETYQDAILELVWNLLPGDKKYTGYLITYGNEAEMVVNTTWDSDKIADQIKEVEAGRRAPPFSTPFTWRAPSTSWCKANRTSRAG